MCMKDVRSHVLTLQKEQQVEGEPAPTEPEVEGAVRRVPIPVGLDLEPIAMVMPSHFKLGASRVQPSSMREGFSTVCVPLRVCEGYAFQRGGQRSSLRFCFPLHDTILPAKNDAELHLYCAFIGAGIAVGKEVPASTDYSLYSTPPNKAYKRQNKIFLI